MIQAFEQPLIAVGTVINDFEESEEQEADSELPTDMLREVSYSAEPLGYQAEDIPVEDPAFQDDKVLDSYI